MLNSIRKKLIAGFSIILLITTASTIYNISGYMDNKDHIMHIKEKAVKGYGLANEIKINVLQTRLYFADASASKSLNELNKTEEYAAIFKKNLDEYSQLDEDMKPQIVDLNSSFDRFFSYGKEMTEMYIMDGHEAGNIMMDQFDKMGEEILIKVTSFRDKSQDILSDDLIEIDTHIAMKIQMSIVLAIFTLILSIIVAIFLGNGITKPIKILARIFNELGKGEGDLTQRIKIKSRDEIGRMADAFNRFMDSLESMVLNIKCNSLVISNGSLALSESSVVTTQGISAVNDHMAKVTTDNLSISDSITQIAASITEIAQASQASVRDAQDICSSAGIVNNIAKDSEKLAFSAKLEMEKIEEVSSHTIEITQKLGKEAAEIGDITVTIKNISSQTNLLALNAAIEAARAGEQGKGFAVVAEEIRKLAESSNKSARMIEDIIKKIQEMIKQTIQATTDSGANIKKGRRMVENVSDHLESITEGVSGINERIQSIATSTEEQSSYTEELSATMETINNSNTKIAETIQEVSENISIQADTVADLSATASGLYDSAEQLNGLVNKFKVK